MSVDEATVRRVAKLARIKVKEENVARLAGELNSILHWIEQLNEVDVAGVEPLTSVVTMDMKKRKDIVTDGANPMAVVANAPALGHARAVLGRDGGQFGIVLQQTQRACTAVAVDPVQHLLGEVGLQGCRRWAAGWGCNAGGCRCGAGRHGQPGQHG